VRSAGPRTDQLLVDDAGESKISAQDFAVESVMA